MMEKQCLNTGWLFAKGTVFTGEPQAAIPPQDGPEWRTIDIPGDINLALERYGIIPNAHFDENGKELYWITSCEWWYQKTFDAAEISKQKKELIFESIDGTADIWLNHHFLGTSKNAFYPHKYDVSGILQSTGNKLLLRFRSIDQLLGSARFGPQNDWKTRRSYLRKPQYNFGWDWSLPIPSLGVCGGVMIEYDNEIKIVDCSVQTYKNGRIDFAFETTPQAVNQGYELRVFISGHGCSMSKTILRKQMHTYTNFHITEPHLWYPNGYGEQPLYDYCIELWSNGRIYDSKNGRFGIREVAVLEEPFTEDAGVGYSFWITVNGKRTFCKGGNWIPTELWPGRIEPNKYDFYIQKAKEANFTMLRVWGGGIYESDRFYDLCDELGIMVWQDFMFASCSYPVNQLRDEITSEAYYQILRLRNHPCIAIWCGCNEDVYSWSEHQSAPLIAQTDTGSYSEVDLEYAVDRYIYDPQLYTMLLRGLVSKYAPNIPYVESSPASRDGIGNLANSGNCHISCWKYALFETGDHYERFRDHFTKVCPLTRNSVYKGLAVSRQ